MDSSAKFSFSFSKMRPPPKVVAQSIIRTESKKLCEKVEYLASFENCRAQPLQKTEEEELTIPLKVSQSNLRASLVKKYIKADPEDQLTMTAIRELSGARDDGCVVIDSKISNLILEMPKIAEAEIVDADYDQIPIEQFGLALLKGMGFKEENKGPSLEDYTSKIRLKGLGLGADPTVLLKARQADKASSDIVGKERLAWKAGARCHVVWGKHDGQYGTIEGIDGDTGRVVVRLTATKRTERIMQPALRLVSETEFEKYAHYLNKSSADRYKENKIKENDSQSDEVSVNKRIRLENEDDGHYSRSSNGSSRTVESQTWVRSGLLVRLTARHGPNSRYYKEKVKLISVSPASGRCICETALGRILQNIRVRDMQTVVPQHRGERVRIVSGKYADELGKLMDRNDKQATASVLLIASGKVICADFDDICAMYI